VSFNEGDRVVYIGRLPEALKGVLGEVRDVNPNYPEQYIVRFEEFDAERVVHGSNLSLVDEATRAGDDAAVYMATLERESDEKYDFEKAVYDLFQEAAELLLSKHRDYGPLNIAHSPGGPVNGLRVRLHDKLARLNHLTDQAADPEHESLEDTWRDIVGYGAIGLLVSRGEWPA
jgi:hypothetical protein